MPVIERIKALHNEMTAWRHDIHRHPELAFEEHRTAGLVADQLASFGVDEIATGIGRTGVVGVIEGRHAGEGMIALRADMDALAMDERAEDRPHRSVHDGRMHACGHDGHTAMLLGAARYLAETRDFAGRVVLVFQPAEEGRAGAKAMIEDGLLTRWPVSSIWGLHNWPAMPPGTIGVRSGPIMAAADFFEISVRGRGGHAAMPHQVIDPVPIAAQLITALQALISRRREPTDAAVLSVTKLHAGSAYNVIPDSVEIAGTARTIRPETRENLAREVREMAQALAAAHGGEADVNWIWNYPPTVNPEAEAAMAVEIAGAIVGAENVIRDAPPSMGAEDFAYFLEQKPGCYIWLGQGGGPGGCMLHSSSYDFNDEVLPIGASWLARMAETCLKP